MKLGTRPQGGESKRRADNIGHCDLLFGIFKHSYHHNRIGITTEKKPSSSSPAIMHALDSSIIFADMTLLVITARISIK